MKKGIKVINQVWDRSTGPNWDVIKQNGWVDWVDNEYLLWRGIIDVHKENGQTSVTSSLETQEKYIEIASRLTPLNKVKTKMIYWKLINRKFKKPTSQSYISKKLDEPDIEWSSVYSRIRKSTIDTRLRAFQFKIINNCLFLNKKLYDFKIVDSPKCTFCLNQNESTGHFFVECNETNNFYMQCRNWLKQANIKLPDLNLKNVLLGSDGNNI